MHLRSVNLSYDLSTPERLAHYRPTSRSVTILRAAMQPDATMAVAAYGSGKSLAAGVGALIVQNNPVAMNALRPVIERLKTVDADLYRHVINRGKSTSRGHSILLNGHQDDIVQALLRDLSSTYSNGHRQSKSVINSNPRLLDTLDHISESDADHVTIVWDEFGRHIEGLIARGETHKLQAVQTIAEWTTRAENPTVSLLLLMHQNLLAYATGLNQTTRGEWRKIEGRFRHIQYLDNSREIYALIAELIKHKRPAQFPTTSESKLRTIANQAINVSWFDTQDLNEILELLRSSEPITAVALQSLPKVIARIGQNERSLFSFVDESDLKTTVGTQEVYRAFSDTMRTDIGIGGTHRLWVETENALSRANGSLEHEALTATCLFQLGTAGERHRLSRQVLELALSSRHGCGARRAASTVQSLIDRKILIHRKHRDDISIWCGTDVNIATKIQDYRTRHLSSFTIVPFLNQHRRAPFVRPSRHNEEFGVTRYLVGHYVTASDVLGASTPLDLTQGQGLAPWGSIIYVLADSDESISQVRSRIKSSWAATAPQSIFVVPQRSIPIEDAAIEVEALIALRKDDTILGEDPLVGEELDDLLAVARSHLDAVLHRLISDRSTETDWFASGSRLYITPTAPAGIAISRLLDRWYPRTPTIANDQLMRNQLSRQMRTARVRILLRIIERSHEPRLGYSMTDKSAEASIYRTVLERTRLHISNATSGRFAEPDDIECTALRYSWKIIQKFFQEPQETPKSLSSLVSSLTSRPIGMPMGVMPIIVMAGYRSFARAISVRTDGEYVKDLLGFNAASMFDHPSRHTVRVYPIDRQIESYLRKLAHVFSNGCPPSSCSRELIRFTSDALNLWQATIPTGASRSTLLSKNSHKLLAVLATSADPGALFLKELPNVFSHTKKPPSYQKIVTDVAQAKDQIDALSREYMGLAIDVIAEILSVNQSGTMLERVESWVRCFNVTELRQRRDLKMTDKAVLRTAYDTLKGKQEREELAQSLSSILLQKRFDQWQDSTVDDFRLALRECKNRIEDSVLTSRVPAESLVPLIVARIQTLQDLLQSSRNT